MSLALAVMILLITLIIAALAIFLIATIVRAHQDQQGPRESSSARSARSSQKTAPVNGVLDAINGNLVAGRNLLENLFIKKAGVGHRRVSSSRCSRARARSSTSASAQDYPVVNTGIVYTRGTQILASLGRGAPIGAAHAKGPAVRDPKYATTAAAMLYPRPGGDPRARPKSPVVGGNSPQQYEASGDARRASAQPRRLARRRRRRSRPGRSRTGRRRCSSQPAPPPPPPAAAAATRRPSPAG